MLIYPQRIHMVCACFGLASILDGFAEECDGADDGWRYTNVNTCATTEEMQGGTIVECLWGFYRCGGCKHALVFLPHIMS